MKPRCPFSSMDDTCQSNSERCRWKEIRQVHTWAQIHPVCTLGAKEQSPPTSLNLNGPATASQQQASPFSAAAAASDPSSRSIKTVDAHRKKAEESLRTIPPGFRIAR
ncbi:hypothetical protein ACLOJK_020575 [Asimina triloba]